MRFGIKFFFVDMKQMQDDVQGEKRIVVPRYGVLKFTADWCGPCRKIAPVLDELSKHHNICVTHVNVDEHNEISDEFNVSSIPVTVFIYESNEISRVVGADVDKIEKSFKSLGEKIGATPENLEKKSKKNQIFLPNCKEAEVKNERA
tara:strand:+ start:4720 stop:5160 length:441 start_codon:yes stop_codon:yes gene_type:complete